MRTRHQAAFSCGYELRLWSLFGPKRFTFLFQRFVLLNVPIPSQIVSNSNTHQPALFATHCSLLSFFFFVSSQHIDLLSQVHWSIGQVWKGFFLSCFCKSVCQSFRPVTLSGKETFCSYSLPNLQLPEDVKVPAGVFFLGSGGFRSYAFGSCVIADDLRANDKGLGLQKPPCSLLPTLDFKVRLKTPRYFFTTTTGSGSAREILGHCVTDHWC